MTHRPVALAAAVVLLLAGCAGTSGPAGSAGSEPTVTASGTPAGESPSSARSDTAAESAAARLDSEPLEDFGCGYAFTVGAADQTVQLSLFDDGGYGDAPQPGTVEVGQGEWTGWLAVGRDLFAQWCDDVIGPDEPEVVEEARWEVTGTLTWEFEQGDGQCPTVATATLTQATAATDGGPVELPPTSFRNEFFGCFAG